MLMVGAFTRGSEGRCHPPAVVILLSWEALLFSLLVYLSSFFPSAFICPISLFHSPLLMISPPSPFILSLLLSSTLSSPYLRSHDFPTIPIYSLSSSLLNSFITLSSFFPSPIPHQRERYPLSPLSFSSGKIGNEWKIRKMKVGK
jgi:hypothetical protein